MTTGINATIRTFGYPDSVVAELTHWIVLLRPQQATLGALVLAARGEATRFGDLTAAAFSELHEAIGSIEKMLAASFRYDKINYLMLMMVDPQVHFHVLPRYAATQTFENVAFEDPGWPKAPALAHSTEIDQRTRDLLRQRLRANWPGPRTVTP
jgi:diadenosine tetraphosphate (Ap4A) HIT family hydrolase